MNMRQRVPLKCLEKWVWLVTFFLITSDLAVGESGESYFSRVLKDYDKEVKPANRTEVSVRLSVTHMRIDEASDSMYIDGYLSTMWQDERLEPLMTSYRDTPLPSSIGSRLYRPKVILTNAMQVTVADTMGREEYWHLSTSNMVFHSIRLRGQFYCNEFPVHSNYVSCPVVLEPDVPADVVYLSWSNNVPLSFGPNKIGPGYSSVDNVLFADNKNFSTGAISHLSVRFLLLAERNFKALVIYVVSFLLILMAWLGFWLDGKPMTRRGCLYVIILLLVQCGYIRANHPSVMPAGVLPIWLSVCELFIYAALVQFITVHVVMTVLVGKIRRLKPTNQETVEEMNTDRVSHMIDIICAVIYLVAFIIYSIMFWTAHS